MKWKLNNAELLRTKQLEKEYVKKEFVLKYEVKNEVMIGINN